MADEAKLLINGREYPMPTSFTLGEARMVKRLTGKSMDELGDLSGADPDWMVALVWIAMHRDDPTLTVEQVEALMFEDLEFTEADEGAPSPPVTSEPNDELPVSSPTSSTNGEAGSGIFEPEMSLDSSGIPS